MELSERFIEAMNLQTQAITYLANVIGSKADNGNTATPKVSLDAVVVEEVIEDDHEPITYEHIKTAINMFAKKAGKEEALAMVKKFAGSNDIKDIKKEDYHEFFLSTEV